MDEYDLTKTRLFDLDTMNMINIATWDVKNYKDNTSIITNKIKENIK